MTGAIQLGQLALDFGCELAGDPDVAVTHVGTLASAGPESLAFLANPHYEKYLAKTGATCVVLAPALAPKCPTNALIHDDPYLIYAQIAGRLHPASAAVAGVHASANVASDAVVHESAEIGPGVVLGARVSIGSSCVIGAGSVVEAGAQIGSGSRLVANVFVGRDCKVGQRCVLAAGSVVGSDGFGYAPSADGWVTVPQVGTVRLGDDVEVGANTCIDRGAIGDTIIEDGVKIDNLVQIAHNVRVGAHSAMAAQVGIAGSTTIGKNCLFAGHSGAVGHVNICDGVIVSGKTMVTRNIDEPGQYGAALPAMPMKLYRRVVARIRQLDKLAQRVSGLEKNSQG